MLRTAEKDIGRYRTTHQFGAVIKGSANEMKWVVYLCCVAAVPLRDIRAVLLYNETKEPQNYLPTLKVELPKVTRGSSMEGTDCHCPYNVLNSSIKSSRRLKDAYIR